MNSDPSLTATIENVHFDDPDGSGETSLTGCIKLEATGDVRYELFIVQQVLRNGKQSILSVMNEEQEDFLGGGSALKIDFSSGYFQTQDLRVTPTATLSTEVLGCSAHYGQLADVNLQSGMPGIYGLNGAYTLGKLEIESISVSVSAPDGDGDVRVEVRVLVCNKTNSYIPRLILKSRAIATGGREIDDQTTDESLSPWEAKCIELSFYSLKQNRLRDLKIATELTLFKVDAHLEVEHSLQLRL